MVITLIGCDVCGTEDAAQEVYLDGELIALCAKCQGEIAGVGVCPNCGAHPLRQSEVRSAGRCKFCE